MIKVNSVDIKGGSGMNPTGNRKGHITGTCVNILRELNERSILRRFYKERLKLRSWYRG